MASKRENPIGTSQQVLLERAAAVTRDQINAAIWAVNASELSGLKKSDTELLAAAIQALATNYHAEVLRARAIK